MTAYGIRKHSYAPVDNFAAEGGGPVTLSSPIGDDRLSAIAGKSGRRKEAGV
jgi:hypothetical protein